MNEAEFTTWLMEAATPSIQYQTLVDLLARSAEEKWVAQARQAIMKSGPVPAILSHQSGNGNWLGERSFYTPKYTSTHWSLMLLAELSVDGCDPRFQQGVRYMLEKTANEVSQRLENHLPSWSCFWGNLLRYALQSGQSENAQIENIIFYLILNLHDGPCLCEHNGGSACAWGVARTLWGLAALPKERRTPETEEAIARGVDFLLTSSPLVKVDHPIINNKEINPLWFKLNFPLFYQADILFSLRVLDELDVLDHPSLQPALDWLERRRGHDGHWRGTSPYRQRTWRELGDRAETDRWVSLQASRILLHAGRIPERESRG